MRKFVIGDIHGAWKALTQCMERSKFNVKEDQLICLGDVSDGWPQTKECIEFLMSLPNLIMLKGNHDVFTIEWAKTGIPPTGWEMQGGYATIESYKGQMPEDHIRFLENAKSYHKSNDNRLFVHAGIEMDKSLEEQDEDIFLWNRTLFKNAITHLNEENPPVLTPYDAIYIGHTPVHRNGFKNPVKACEVWMMDTGAGWDGVLSIMNISTNEYWTSDQVPTLYPGHKGRFIS